MVLLALLGLGLVWTVQQGRSTWLLAAGEPERAASVWPDNVAAWRASANDLLTQNPDAALAAARRAVAGDAEDWQNWALLAQMQVEEGDLSAARTSMRAMSTRAVEYEAHWRYANLLLLTGDDAGFWTQIRAALAFVPANYMTETMNQTWLAANGNAATFLAAVRAAAAMSVDPRQPPALAMGALDFLLTQGQLEAAGAAWETLTQLPLDSEERMEARALGRRTLAQLAGAGAPAAARAALAEGEEGGVFSAGEAPTTTNAVSDPNFAVAPDAPALPWSLCAACGAWAGGDGTLHLDLDGHEADSVTLATQTLLLDPAKTYELSYRSAGATLTGLSVAVTAGTHELARADAAAGVTTARFTTPATPAAVQLEVIYQRPEGAMPLASSSQLSGFAVTPAAEAGH